MKEELNSIRLSPHFGLKEFLKLNEHPDNIPTVEDIVNMTYGCLMLLEPSRDIVGCPIIVTSGFRNPAYNAQVGGVVNSQHLTGCAADIRPSDPSRFQAMKDFLRISKYTDQLLTGRGWLHVSWTPFGKPRNLIRIGYYY